MSEEKKKGWFKKHWFLTCILIVVVIIIIAVIANSGKKANSNTGGNGNTAASNYPCPELSSMKLNRYDAAMQTWVAEVAPYKSGNLEVVYTYNSQVEENMNVIYCDAGSAEGQNANWVYCGDFIRPIVAQYTDSSGNIIKKTSVEVTFDKSTKQYLGTECDTYALYENWGG